MLSKQNRLDKHQYNQVFKEGKTLHSPFFMMKYIENPENKRFSVVVPKKVLKKAYQRNTLRRFIYNAIRFELENISAGDYIFVLKKINNEYTKEDVVKSIFEYIQKTK